MINTNSFPWKAFFATKSIGELKVFRAGMDCDFADQRAFVRYIDSWEAMSNLDDAASFDPFAHVSEDLSSALYFSSPCVFMGSNSWALAAECDPEIQAQYVTNLAVRICNIREFNPEATMVVAVVPEKDYTIDRMFNRNSRDDRLVESMRVFSQQLASHNITFVFDGYIEHLSHYQSIGSYDYPDSHLPSANYVQIMSNQLAHAGVGWDEVRWRLSTSSQPEYCDLVDKLRLDVSNPVDFSLPNMASPELKLIGGSDTYSQPLGDTMQVYSNTAPIDDRKLLILGDSHSSIYSRKKLTYLNAHVFSETTFQWNPCGFREEICKVPQPVIFLEIAQRFLHKSADATPSS